MDTRNKVTPLAWVLKHDGLLAPHWRGLAKDIKRNVLGDVTGYDTQELNELLKVPRLVYMCCNMTKSDREAIGLPHHAYFENKYNITLPRFQGKPRIQVVSLAWFTRSSVRKILYSIKLKGIENVFINALEEDSKPYSSSEEYVRSLQAVAEWNGTIWFNGRLVYSPYDIFQAHHTMYVFKEVNIAHIKGATGRVILSNSLRIGRKRKLNIHGKAYKYKGDWVYEYQEISNDGRYVTKWRLEAFYENNPDASLYRVIEKDGLCYLDLLLVEDAEFEYPRAITEFFANPEIEGMSEEERDEYYVWVDAEYATKVTNEYSPLSQSHDPNPEDKLIKDECPMKITIEDKTHYVLENYLSEYQSRLNELGIFNIEQFEEFCKQNGITNYVQVFKRVK